jgi:hypothetical protein
MSVFLKIKDTFNKALKKGVECDSVYLTDEDYVEFCSDFNKENISEITINNIKLSISKVKDKDNSFLTSRHIELEKIEVSKKNKNTAKKSVIKSKKLEDKFYLKTK